MYSTLKHISVLKAKNGQWTAKAHLDNGKNVFLHSAFAPQKEAELWLKNLEIKEYSAYVVLGMGLGYYVQALLTKIPKTSIVIVLEPTLEMSFIKLIKEKLPKANWLKSKKLYLANATSLRDASAFINKRLQENGIKSILLVKHFPLYNIYKNVYEPIADFLPAKVQELMNLDYNFRIEVGSTMFKQAWFNLPEILKNPSINLFKGALKGKKAVVVAGGPSLDKGIDLLAKEQKDFVIICAGSAIGALAKKGIQPHFVIVIDPYEHNAEEVAKFLTKEVVLVAPYFIPKKLFEKHQGYLCFYKTVETHKNANVLDGINNLLPKTELLFANVSVAVPAINFALHIGIEDIVLIGQDLAFLPQKTHADGSLAHTYYKEEFKENYFKVDGWQGEELLTDIALQEVRLFLETWFALLSKKHRIINASEGGVLIKGIKHMTFLETLKLFKNDKEESAQNEIKSIIEQKNASWLINTNNIKKTYTVLNQGIQSLEKWEKEIFNLTEIFVKLGAMVLTPDKEKMIKTCEQIEGVFEKMTQDKYFVLWQSVIAVWLELFALKKGDTMNYWEKYQQYRNLGKQAESFLKKAKKVLKEVEEKLKGMVV